MKTRQIGKTCSDPTSFFWRTDAAKGGDPKLATRLFSAFFVFSEMFPSHKSKPVRNLFHEPVAGIFHRWTCTYCIDNNNYLTACIFFVMNSRRVRRIIKRKQTSNVLPR